MKPQFPKGLLFSAFVILGLLALDAPGYLKLANPTRLASLSQNLKPDQFKSTAAKTIQLCPEENTELSKRLKQLGFQSCKSK